MPETDRTSFSLLDLTLIHKQSLGRSDFPTMFETSHVINGNTPFHKDRACELRNANMLWKSMIATLAEMKQRSQKMLNSDNTFCSSRVAMKQLN